MIKEDNYSFIKNFLYKENRSNSRKILISLFASIFSKSSEEYALNIVPPYKSIMMTHEALMNICMLLELILKSNVNGEIIEIGSYDGLTAMLITEVLKFNRAKRKLKIYDSFKGLTDFTTKDSGTNLVPGQCRSSKRELINNFLNSSLTVPIIIEGNVLKTLPEKLPDKIAFVHLDLDLYKPTYWSLKLIYPQLSKGAVVVLDDYNNPTVPGVKAACIDYFKDKKIRILELFAGDYPQFPFWPRYKNKTINKKYQAYFTKE